MSNQIIASKIADVAAQLRGKSLTASQLCEFCLKRITSTASLNSFITVTDDLARDNARESVRRYEQGSPLSLIDGIPIAVKDNFSTDRVRTTCASKMLSNYMPRYNATVVERLLKAGAVLVGKTNMDEYAMGSGTYESAFGPSVNPWNSGLPFGSRKELNNNELDVKSNNEEDSGAELAADWHLAGGSSGGSAIAVATGAAFAALGSDTGGSTRHPAGLVGVCGYKPSYGTLSRHGLLPLTHSMDTPGIMAKYVADVRLVFQLLCGEDNRDPTSISDELKLVDSVDVSRLRIGIPVEYHIEGMSAEISDLWAETCDRFRRMGAEIVNVSLPHTKYCLSSYAVLKACDIASNFACYDGIEFGYRAEEDEDTKRSADHLYAKTRTEGFNDTVKGFIFAGNYFMTNENYEEYFVRAAKVRRLVCDDFKRVFNEQRVDILLTPVTLTDAPTVSEWKGTANQEILAREDFCTQPANMAGLPSISVPCRLSRRGMPLGLQLIGPHLSDHFVLSVAEVLEETMQFPIGEYYG